MTSDKLARNFLQLIHDPSLMLVLIQLVINSVKGKFNLITILENSNKYQNQGGPSKLFWSNWVIFSVFQFVVKFFSVSFSHK